MKRPWRNWKASWPAWNAALDESIAIYERGEALKKHCEKLLAAAENRIEKIRLDRAGQPQGVEPLDGA